MSGGGHSASNTCNVRLVSVYATAWRYNGRSSADLSAKFALGDLGKQYNLYKDQLPRLLPATFLGSPDGRYDIGLATRVHGIRTIKSDALLFALPSNQVVIAVIQEFTTCALTDTDAVRPLTEVLDQSIQAEITINEVPLADCVKDLQIAAAILSEGRDVLTEEDWTGRNTGEFLLPERHQLVFISRINNHEDVPPPSVVDEIIYRERPPYREEFVVPKRPGQLNHLQPAAGPQAPGNSQRRLMLRRDQKPQPGERQLTLGVVTSYASLLYGHQKYVEDSIFLSTVHAVGTAATFRQIWHEAYHHVKRFRDTKLKKAPGEQIRADFETLTDELGNLEFDLTFSVEFPLMRIETFHSDLYEAMDLSKQADALSRMFAQIGGSLRSEISAIEVREQKRADRRQKWNAFAASILSIVGVSVGFVIAFLGVNTIEVPGGGEGEISMWDPHFSRLYLIAALFALTPAFLILFPFLQDWALKRKRHRALWWGLGALGIGAGALAVVSYDKHLVEGGHVVVSGALVTAVGVFALLVGLSLMTIWLWKRYLGDAKKRKRLWRWMTGRDDRAIASSGVDG